MRDKMRKLLEAVLWFGLSPTLEDVLGRDWGGGSVAKMLVA